MYNTSTIDDKERDDDIILSVYYYNFWNTVF